MPFVHRFFQELLRKLSKVIYRHPSKILWLSILFTGVSIYLATTRFQVINTYSQLLDDSEVRENYLNLEREFGTDETYLVLIQSENPEINREVALKVGDFLKGLHPYVTQVWSKMDFSKLENRFLLLASKEELQGMEREIALQLKALQTASVNLDLNSVLDQANRSFNEKYLRRKESWVEFKPFIEQFKAILNRLADQIEGKKELRSSVSRPSGTSVSNAFSDQDIASILEEQQFISFRGGRAILVTGARGKVEADSISPFTETVKKIRKYLGELEQQYPTVKLGLTGEPVLNDDELQTSTRDTEYASIITLVLIALLFFFSYRNLERPIYAGLVLGMGMAGTFAFTMVVIGHFNVISFAVIPMVLGLGIDFGIQILGRYEEELGNGKGVEEALDKTLSRTGVAVLTGGSTTAAAFFTLCFNNFQGLRELGAIAGASMIICLLANFIVLPAIFVLRDRRRSPEDLRRKAAHSPWSFLAPLDQNIVRHPKAALLITAIITILSIYGIFKVRFDYNLLHLQNQKLESVQVLQELFKVSDNSTLFASVVANDLEEARALEKKILALPSVAKIESVTRFFPEDQKEKIPIIQRILAPLNRLKLNTNVVDQVDVERAKRDLQLLLEQSRAAVAQAKKYQSVSKQAREAVEVFDGLIPPLERALNAMKGLSQEELGKRLNQTQMEIFGTVKRNFAWLKTQKADREIRFEDLPPEISRRFVSPSGKILLQVYSKGDIWEREPNKQFIEELRTVAPHVTGTPVQNYEYIELMRTSFLDAVGWAFVAIVILILLHFQSITLTILAIFPLLLAVIWRTGIMGWYDIPFNPANIVTLPLIIGIDVAYGVYMVDRFREDGGITMFSTSTGKAIMMTGLTALFGFASLLVSDYEGMFSIGLLMSLGIAIGMITTMLVLPQVLVLMQKKSKAKHLIRD